MITLLIPTLNRSDFLQRLLDYYAATGYRHDILIGDASDEARASKMREVVKQFDSKLRIRYRHLPGQSIAHTVFTLNKEVETPYATLVPDDDFITTQGIEQAISFLEVNKEYTAANGQAIIFFLKQSGCSGEFKEIGHYKMQGLEWDTGADRLKNILSDYFVALFSVHRTEAWKSMWRPVEAMRDTAFAAELLPCCLSACYGKIKHLTTLYLIRQGHDRRNILKDIYDWVTSREWHPDQEQFTDSLVAALQRVDGLSAEDARQVVKIYFWFHLSKEMNHQLQNLHGLGLVKPKTKARRALQSFPGARQLLLPAWRAVRSTVVSQAPTSLASLLNKNSVYYTHFAPVYEAVTKNVSEEKKLKIKTYVPH